jgi:hypothetical protein
MTADPASRLPDPSTGRTDWRLARALSQPTLSHDCAMATISHAFGGAGVAGLLERIDDVARPMFGVGDGSLFAQADALADVITNRLGLQVNGREWRALLLGDALARREAHPLLLASLGHELARRAGLQSVVARSHDDFCCVLITGEMALPVCFGEAPDGLDVSALRSCCAHELAFTILAVIGGRARRSGGRGRPRPRGDADRLGPDRLVAARRSLSVTPAVRWRFGGPHTGSGQKQRNRRRYRHTLSRRRTQPATVRRARARRGRPSGSRSGAAQRAPGWVHRRRGVRPAPRRGGGRARPR